MKLIFAIRKTFSRKMPTAQALQVSYCHLYGEGGGSPLELRRRCHRGKAELRVVLRAGILSFSRLAQGSCAKSRLSHPAPFFSL